MRIAYVILTCEAYEKTRRVWQKETVFGGDKIEQEDIYYLGGRKKESERVFSWGAPDDYLSLPLKVADFFVHTELGETYDWFFLMDDDTYVYVDRLAKRVSFLCSEKQVNPKEEVYAEGCLLTHLAGTPWGIYPSGGAGTLLSSAAYRAIQTTLRGSIRPCPHWCADICLGLWIKSLSMYRMEHDDGYHTDMAPIGQMTNHTALTFHHLKTQEDFWSHWRIGQSFPPALS